MEQRKYGRAIQTGQLAAQELESQKQPNTPGQTRLKTREPRQGKLLEGEHTMNSFQVAILHSHILDL